MVDHPIALHHLHKTHRVELELLSAEIHGANVVVEDRHLQGGLGADLGTRSSSESIGASKASNESGGGLHGESSCDVKATRK